jgi:hypothetical protein
LIANGGDATLVDIAKRLLASGPAGKGDWGRPMAYTRQFGSNFFARAGAEIRETYESMLAEAGSKGEQTGFLKWIEIRYGHLPDFKDAKIPSWKEEPMSPELLEEWFRIALPREFQAHALLALSAMWEGAPKMLSDDMRDKAILWEPVTRFLDAGGLTLPNEDHLEAAYAGFTRGKTINYERGHPGLGHSVAYRGDQGEATIYIYTKGQSNIPDGPRSETVMLEFNEATSEVLSLAQSAGGRIELVERYGTGSPERGEEFLCAEFNLTDNYGSRRTFLYLTGATGNFVKIRVTLRTNEPTDPTARNFADAVAGGLWGRRQVRLH